MDLSATPFSCGLYGGVTSWAIPAFDSQSLKSFPQNSPPPSDRRIFIYNINYLFKKKIRVVVSAIE
jgi:hypothetical protein